MSNNDHQKVLAAGFTIIRERDHYGIGGKPSALHIYAKTKQQPEWHMHERDFKSKAARTRRMQELLNESKIIQD